MARAAQLNLPFVRSPYNYDVMEASDESGLFCPEPTLTQQQFKDDCDISIMLERMARGDMPELGSRTPLYADVSNIPADYHLALNSVIEAKEAFDSLPAKLRARFDNDPGNLMDFLSDVSNRDEAVELGLIARSEDLSTASSDRSSRKQAEEAVDKSVTSPPRKKDDAFARIRKLLEEGEKGDE